MRILAQLQPVSMRQAAHRLPADGLIGIVQHRRKQECVDELRRDRPHLKMRMREMFLGELGIPFKKSVDASRVAILHAGFAQFAAS